MPRSYCQVPSYCGVYYIPQSPHTTVPNDYLFNIQPSWLPRVSLSTLSLIHDTASKTCLTQTFINPSSTLAIPKAKYAFPLYESCAVVSFRCHIGKRVIEGIVKEKYQAKIEYNQAVAKGETAGLLEQLAPDVFTTSLGNIPAGETVKVEIEYIMELKHDAQVDCLRFTIPTSIAPRYGEAPLGMTGALGDGGIKIAVQVSMPSNIRNVQSPSHPISMYLGSHVEDAAEDAFEPKHALATLSQTSAELGKDFVLLVKCADLSSPRALLEVYPTIANSKAIMVTLVPKFTLPLAPRPEIVFVVDRSGSMVQRIAPLRSSLSIFLKSLPLGIKFNICSFGSHHSFLWKESQPYSAESLEVALKHVETINADFGGTDILPPIKSTISKRYKDLPLEIMVLTDGEVWNTEALFEYVSQQTAEGDVRLFSLGIGKDVSHALVEGLARVGKGFAQIVMDEQEGIEGKVVRMLRGGLSVHVNDYRLEWDGKPSHELANKSMTGPPKPKTVRQKISLYDPQSVAEPAITIPAARFSGLPEFVVPSVLQAPFNLPPLFPFSRTTAYAILSPDVAPPSSVWLRGTTPTGDELELEIPVQVVGEKGQTIHQLAARKILQELEEGTGYIHSGKYGIDKKLNPGTFGEWVEREGIRVGVQYGLASNWTSFVAVQKGDQGETASADTGSETIQVDSDDDMDFGFELFPPSRSNDSLSLPIRKRSAGSDILRIEERSRDRMAVPLFSCRRTSSDLLPSLPAPPAPPASGTPAGGINKIRSLERSKQFNTTLVGQDRPVGMAIQPSHFGGPPMSRSRPGGFGDTHQSLSPRQQTKALIALQTFEGSFPLTTALAALLGAKLKDLEAKLVESARTNHTNLSEEQRRSLWATALSVRMFESKLMGERDVWELVVDKAKSWMGMVGHDEYVKGLETLVDEVFGRQ